jgi:hypothetical protein
MTKRLTSWRTLFAFSIAASSISRSRRTDDGDLAVAMFELGGNQAAEVFSRLATVALALNRALEQ